VHTLAALVAAGLLALAVPTGGQGDARVEAGTAVYDVASGTYRLEGGVVITRGVVTLRCRSARYDPRTGEVTASGGVLLSDATRVLSAEGLHAVLASDFEATGVTAFLKEGPVDLSKAATPAAAAACGRNAVTATAEKVRGDQEGHLTLEGTRLTLCDCPGGGAPSWELRSGRAVVTPGERVTLTWPVLWITPRFLLVDRPVPVLAFPYLSVPLADRLSGLLMPELGSSGTSGATLALPYYLTLGPSADLTLTPRYAFGRPRHQVLDGQPSIRGPGGSAELRWAPWPGTAGRIQADALWDLDDEAVPARGVPGAEGLRFALHGVHAQRFDDATTLRVDLDVVGDALYVRDFTSDVLLRDAASRRSAALLTRRGDDGVLELSTAWLQPVSRDGALAAIDEGIFGARLPAFHRWPSLGATLLPVALAGPLRLSGRAGLARFAPPRGATSDGGLDGVGPADRGFVAAAADAGELDGRWQPGERLAVTRLDARAELSAPFDVAGVLSVRPFLRGAALGYLFDAARDPLADAWGVGGVELASFLSRRFGEVRHTLEPRLEWRYGTAVQGRALPAFGYDPWDRAAATPPGADPTFRAPRFAAAAPPGVFQQARLSLATRLASGEVELARGEVGQEVDVGLGRLAEGFVKAAATRGLVSGEADVRFWTAGRLVPAPQPPHASWLDRFSELRLKLVLADGRGDQLRGGLLAVGPGGSGRLGAGVDGLFDPRPTTATGLDALASGTLGAQVRLGPATLGYDARLPVRTEVVLSCQGTGTRVVGPWQVQEHAATLAWDSPCQCFRARATVRVNDCGEVGYSVSLDLGRAAGVQGR
jgi:LPS-assembly protein